MPDNHARSVFLKNENRQDDLSVQKRIYDPKWALPDINHWHDYFEMELFPSGSGTHFLSGRQTDFDAGYMFLVTPSDFHRLNVDRTNIEYYNVSFSESVIPPQIRDFLASRNAPCEVTLSQEDVKQVVYEFEKIIAEGNNSNQFSANMKTECLGKALIIFCRALICQSEESVESTAFYNSAVRRAMDIVQRDFGKNIGLASVALEVGYSPNYLGSLFCAETGIRFTEYLQNKRISHAENLLRNTNLSIKEISETSGFSFPSYFISTFKKKRGCTPVSIRKKDT